MEWGSYLPYQEAWSLKASNKAQVLEGLAYQWILLSSYRKHDYGTFYEFSEMQFQVFKDMAYQ